MRRRLCFLSRAAPLLEARTCAASYHNTRMIGGCLAYDRQAMRAGSSRNAGASTTPSLFVLPYLFFRDTSLFS